MTLSEPAAGDGLLYRLARVEGRFVHNFQASGLYVLLAR